MRWMLIVVLVGCGGGPSNTWWPIGVGDRWTMMNSINGAHTFFEVQAAPADICESPQFIIRITKDSPDTYWGTGGTMSIEWSILVAADGTVWSPGSFWHQTLDCSGPVNETWRAPGDLIVPLGPIRFETTTERYGHSLGFVPACTQDYTFQPGYWLTEAEQVGDDLRVRYVEGPETGRCGAFGERWTFRRGVGLIRIEWANQDCSIGITERE